MAERNDEEEKIGDDWSWDEHSNLYYHPGSGFYHNPSAGWYYNTADGSYYILENGTYVPMPMPCNEGVQCEYHDTASDASNQTSGKDDLSMQLRDAVDGTESEHPPSEWLEDTLIDLYLTRNSQENVNPECLSTSKSDDFQLDGRECFQIEEHDDVQRSHVFAEAFSKDEENWLAQYGQVVQSDEENTTQFAVVDLWDWEMVTESKRKRNVSRLVGRLVKRSNKMHQSLPAAGGLLKTTAISEVHLDLVRVVSGKIYRLRNPCSKYLASLSTYDASNPTRTWDFPDLYSRLDTLLPEASASNCQSTKKVAKSVDEPSSMSELIETIVEKDPNNIYRDRAAERRKLHGRSGIGPGHKQMRQDRGHFWEAGASSEFAYAETSATETATPFTSESKARKIIESMGWKDGQALGRSRKGILEPIQAIGNKGYAGLGWNNTRTTS